MKRNKFLNIIAFLFLISGMNNIVQAAEPGSLIVSVKYFMYNNKIPFLQINSKTKIDKKLLPVPNITFRVYLDSTTDKHKIGEIKTNELGNATVAIPASLKAQWDASPKHIFYCNADATKEFEAAELELEITQAKLLLDTLNDGEARSITATLMEKNGSSWVPVAETDLRIGVKRLGGILSAGTEETVATDEEGVATTLFEREKLPGDKNGNLTLIAKVEDNDIYGNLVTEMDVSWGVKTAYVNNDFNKRSLWATRTKAPYWLLFLANSIIISVWGVIIYLIFQILKMRKMGVKTNK